MDKLQTVEERVDTLLEIRGVHERHGNVQECIVQNFRAKPDTAMRHTDDLDLDEYRAAIAVTAARLPPALSPPTASRAGSRPSVMPPAPRSRVTSTPTARSTWWKSG